MRKSKVVVPPPRPSHEALSQSEIDQLLKAISSGPEEPYDEVPSNRSRKIKIYDFKRPDRMTKGNLRLIANAGEIIAKDLTRYIFAKFHKEAHVHICSVDQLTYEECIRSMRITLSFVEATCFQP